MTITATSCQVHGLAFSPAGDVLAVAAGGAVVRLGVKWTVCATALR